MSVERSESVQPDIAWQVEDTGDDDRPEILASDGLVTLRYLWDALRRHARLWLVTAVLGLVAGFAFPVVMPPSSAASTKLLLTHQPGDDALTAMATDVSLATTETVARRVIDKLHLAESPDDLLTQYTVTAPTERVLQITVSAKTPDDAVRLARALGTTYLDFRMEQVRARQDPLRAQLDQARQRVATLEQKEATKRNANSTNTDGTNGTDGTDQTTTTDDQAPGSPISQARDQVTQLQQSLNSEKAAAALVSSSHVLDPAAVVPKSKLKALVLDVMSGFAGGLVIGVGIIVVRALLSDRLWRRQVVADALRARVMLSLARVRRRRWWQRLTPVVPRTASAGELTFAARQLREMTDQQDASRKTLAVVANDDITPAAILTARLARLYAADGERVVVVDLSRRGAMARELSDVNGVTVHVPDGDGLPYGPPAADPADAADADCAAAAERLRVAWDTADVVLVLSSVSVALGADHLATWVAHAVVVVTAGHSSATRIRTTADLIRLSGMHLDGGILVGSDKNDETAGLPSDETAVPAATQAQDRSQAAVSAGGWHG